MADPTNDLARDFRHERDYIDRTIETVRNHRDADNCWPQWANIFADEIEDLRADVERLREERDEASQNRTVSGTETAKVIHPMAAEYEELESELHAAERRAEGLQVRVYALENNLPGNFLASLEDAEARAEDANAEVRRLTEGLRDARYWIADKEDIPSLYPVHKRGRLLLRIDALLAASPSPGDTEGGQA